MTKIARCYRISTETIGGSHMQLSQPYYIEKRNNGTHKDLNGKWNFCWTDTECENVKNLAFGYECKVPASVYYSLYEAGVLPHPYYGTNSKQYHRRSAP